MTLEAQLISMFVRLVRSLEQEVDRTLGKKKKAKLHTTEELVDQIFLNLFKEALLLDRKRRQNYIS